MVLELRQNEKLLAKIFNVSDIKEGLHILGSPEDTLQVLSFKYKKGHNMRDHRHIPRARVVEKTQEAVVVFKGSVDVRTFGEGDRVVDQRKLVAGDVYISYSGGVGFTVLENNTIMLEFKPGHYLVHMDGEDRVLL